MLRRPSLDDAAAVFGWASDATATRFMAWPRHKTVDDSRAFLALSESEWSEWPAGPYVIESRSTGQLIGSCGLSFSDDALAQVGYILIPSVWGRGLASESLTAQLGAAAVLGSVVFEAAVHPDNTASFRVLEKCGFEPAVPATVAAGFPNLGARRVRALRYMRAMKGLSAAQHMNRADNTPRSR